MQVLPLLSQLLYVAFLKSRFFKQELSCNWDSVLFSEAFLILGRDILSKMQLSIHMKMGSTENLYLQPLQK